jgi:hypothetical protein
VPALTYLKEMADNTCDGQAGGGRQCIIWLLPCQCMEYHFSFYFSKC